MEKQLNITLISQKLEELGYNQTTLSKYLKVSREAVSQWLSNSNFPRPDKLLKLGQLLDIGYNQLIVKENEYEPIVSFRKVGNSKTTELHNKRAREMGYVLEKLVEYLPFETLIKTPQLIEPLNEYNYIQDAVKTIRNKFGIKKITVDADDILRCFKMYKAILIPLLMGTKKNHENALHIHLPKSSTNWVYINLDTKIFDFKFWLIHELGHILAPNLNNSEAEKFIDNFAGAFLFPEEISSQTYKELNLIQGNTDRIKHIFSLSKRYIISPYTVYYEINKYANSQKLGILDLGSEFHAWNNRFVNNYNLVSENIFGDEHPAVNVYIETVEKEFETIIFRLIKEYLSNNPSSSSFIRSALNVSIADAKEIYEWLINGIYQNTA